MSWCLSSLILLGPLGQLSLPHGSSLSLNMVMSLSHSQRCESSISSWFSSLRQHPASLAFLSFLQSNSPPILTTSPFSPLLNSSPLTSYDPLSSLTFYFGSFFLFYQVHCAVSNLIDVFLSFSGCLHSFRDVLERSLRSANLISYSIRQWFSSIFISGFLYTS